jgi:rhomboid protease GluP
VDDVEQPIRITPDMLLSRRVDFERRMRRVPPVTLALVAVLTIVFAGEVAFEVLQSTESVLAAGALSRDAVLDGEVWRLVTAIMLHGSAEHLVSNAIALFILGMVCEHAFGRAQFALLFVATGVAGSLASLLVNPGPSVGASGAIFGLQAAAIVLFRRHRERLLLRDRRIGVMLLVWALYSILSGFVTPWVDNGAHVGGAIAGAAIAYALHPVVITPLPALAAARVRRASLVTAAFLAYAALRWVFH